MSERIDKALDELETKAGYVYSEELEAILTRLVADETAELAGYYKDVNGDKEAYERANNALRQQNERLREAAIHAKDWIERAAPKVQDKTHNLVANRNDQLETTSIIRVKDYQVVLTLLENAILDSVALTTKGST